MLTVVAYHAGLAFPGGYVGVVLHLTEWEEFTTMPPSTLSAVVRQRHIVDGRNKLDRELWTREGWTHRTLGRRSI